MNSASTFDPLVNKANTAAEKRPRRRKNAGEVSVAINEKRTAFFDRLALLNAGALTFSVTLLSPITKDVPTFPPILYLVYGAWVCLLLALASCLLRNLGQMNYHYFDAVMKMQESEIEYIDADTEAISAKGTKIIYSDSTDKFDTERELKINNDNRESFKEGLEESKKLADRGWNMRKVTEWTAAIFMTLGFLLLVVFAILKTYLG